MSGLREMFEDLDEHEQVEQPNNIVQAPGPAAAPHQIRSQPQPQARPNRLVYYRQPAPRPTQPRTIIKRVPVIVPQPQPKRTFESFQYRPQTKPIVQFHSVDLSSTNLSSNIPKRKRR